MGLIAFVVDVDALAVVGGFTHRMFVVQQQIVQAVQRPGSREKQGEKQAPKAPQVECAGQGGVILKGEVNGRNERSKRGRRLIAQYLQKRSPGVGARASSLVLRLYMSGTKSAESFTDGRAPGVVEFFFVAHQLAFEGIDGGCDGGFERFARFFVHDPAARYVKPYFGDFVLHPASGVLQFQVDFCFNVAAVEITVQAVHFFLDVRHELLVGVKVHRFDTNVHHTHTEF